MRYLILAAVLVALSSCSGSGTPVLSTGSAARPADASIRGSAVSPADSEAGPSNVTDSRIVIGPTHSPVLYGANASVALTLSEAGYTGGFTQRLDTSRTGAVGYQCPATIGFGGGDPGTCRDVPSDEECDDSETGGSIIVQTPDSGPTTTVKVFTIGPPPKSKFYCAVDFVDASNRAHRSTTTWLPAPSPSPRTDSDGSPD